MAPKRVKTTSEEPLNKTQILRAAILLVDEEGVDGLSMRKLSQKMGVGTMSLYNHVANKHEILTGVLGMVLEEIEAPTPTADWKSAIRVRAISARNTFLAHPWAVNLLDGRYPSPLVMAYHNTNLGSFRKAGFSPVNTVHANTVFEAFVYGSALQAVSRKDLPSERFSQVAKTMLENIPAKAFPFIVETLQEVISQEGYSYEEEFLFSLDMILLSMEPLRESPK